MVGRRKAATLKSPVRFSSSHLSKNRVRKRAGFALSTILDNASLVCLIVAAFDKNPRHGRTRQESSVLYKRPKSGLADSGDRHALQKQWSSGIRAALLDKAGHVTYNGGGKETALLLPELEWDESMWKRRRSQIARWLHFCDEEIRRPLPPEE